MNERHQHLYHEDGFGSSRHRGALTLVVDFELPGAAKYIVVQSCKAQSPLYPVTDRHSCGTQFQVLV